MDSRFRGNGVAGVPVTRASHIWVDTGVILKASVFNADTGQWEEQVLDSHVDDTDTIVLWHSEDANTGILVHELLHTLGFAAHVDPARFMDASIMNDEDVRERIGGSSSTPPPPIPAPTLAAAGFHCPGRLSRATVVSM